MKEVYTLRKELKGMVIGPLDKNKGELWVMCPTLYHRALRKAYSVATGYQPIFPAKLSQYRKKRYTTEELPRQIMRDERMQDPRQRGSEKDIINLWARIAKSKGWDKYAKCDTSGGAINQPYILLKAKNVTDPKKRQLSWGLWCSRVHEVVMGRKVLAMWLGTQLGLVSFRVIGLGEKRGFLSFNAAWLGKI